MRLYAGPSKPFITQATQDGIASRLKDAFFQYYRYDPSPNEVNAWRYSLKALAQVFHVANLTDHGVFLEYALPLSSKRLDCMITGHDRTGAQRAVVVELKQWQTCEESDGPNEVVSFVGGAQRDVLHPAAQVGQYRLYLEDTHTAFHEGDHPVGLSACSYLHNYSPNAADPLFAPKFAELLQANPLFTAGQAPDLSAYLTDALADGKGMPVLTRIEQGQYRPSKKLMQHVAQVIDGKPQYVLLDEQLVVFDKVLTSAHAGMLDKRKRVLIVKGGPGTGKSVIALNLLAALLRNEYNTHYATGSKAFTETLRRIIGTRGAAQFKYFNSYGQAPLNAIDVLVCDESHRIRKTSNSRFTKAENRAALPQIEELIRVSKVAVFFIDDNQVVRPNEIGSVEYIRNYAAQMGCDIREFELEAQFRCNGSDAFVNWVNNTLGIKRTANVLWTGEENFEFKTFDSPQALENAIRAKAAQGHDARLSAGFCWPWSNPNPDGTLEEDVVIGNYRRPWNAKSNAGRLAPGIPREAFWATDKRGIDQIGCIYTAQGFEFDYVGVIWGKDLVYNFDTNQWQGSRSESQDSTVKRGGEQFLDLVKNTYRVLLTRGLKGCYVHFMDKDTERFVRSRIEQTTDVWLRVAEEQEK